VSAKEAPKGDQDRDEIRRDEQIYRRTSILPRGNYRHTITVKNTYRGKNISLHGGFDQTLAVMFTPTRISTKSIHKTGRPKELARDAGRR